MKSNAANAFIVFVVIFAIGSLILVFRQDNNSITGNVFLAEKEYTLPEGYQYKNRYGSNYAGSLCPQCSGGAMRLGQSQIVMLCTGDFAVKYEMASALSNRAMMNVNGQIVTLGRGEIKTLKDGTQVEVLDVNTAKGTEMVKYRIGITEFVAELQEGGTSYNGICNKRYRVTLDGIDEAPRKAHFTVNGESISLKESETKNLKDNTPVTALFIGAGKDKRRMARISVG